MQYYQPSPSDDSEFNSSEVSPVIEITCAADFSTLFAAILHGKDLDMNAAQFMTTMLAEQLQEVASIIPRAYHDYLLGQALTTKAATVFFKTANAVLKGLYRESGDIEDVPHVLALSNFLLELGDTLEVKLEKMIYSHPDFYLDRSSYADRILTDMLEDLPALKDLEPCLEIYRNTNKQLQCETLQTVANCASIYTRTKRWPEAFLCAEWLTDVLQDLRHGTVWLYRDKVKIPRRPEPFNDQRDLLVWNGTRSTLLTCGELYDKTFQPKRAIKCYDVLAEMCNPKFFKSQESCDICLADILNKRAHARVEAGDYENANHDARRVIRLLKNLREEGDYTRKSAQDLLDDSPVDPKAPDTERWGFNTEWTPDKDKEDDGGLLG